MNRRLWRVLIAFTLAPGLLHRAQAADSRPVHAQRLVDQTVTAEADLLAVNMVVVSPHARQHTTVFAARVSLEAAAPVPDQTGAVSAGKPLGEVEQDGARIRVTVPLEDRSGRVLGALGLVYRYRAGESQYVFLRRAEAVRDELAGQIDSKQALFAREKLVSATRRKRRER